MSGDLLGPAGAGSLGAPVTLAVDKISRVLSLDALRLLDQIRETIGVRSFGAKLRVTAAEHVRQIQTTLLACHRLGLLYYLKIGEAA